ncbi:MAG: signal recognition particle protein [Gemmatimonadetes bacterium RBG_16_66_8]|nr:MAG: signal recognition particle protein [Gemmatimonadetes bacterium RBG_16_66_8]
MFTALSSGLSATLRGLAGRGVLTEEAIREGLRDVRRILLEADVGYEIARDFTERVRARAVGVEQLKAVNPGQQLVKIVHDELVGLLGEKQAPLAFASVPPTVILLVGLQGSGKTTTADVYRPAAEEQLRQLGEKVGVGVWGRSGLGGRDGSDEAVVELVQSGIATALHERARTVIVDTAGRLHVDEALMRELVALKGAVVPREILLVADGMTGQDAVRIAKGFQEALGLTGVILTKLDGDARGGAALSIYGTAGAPIKFIGVGEGMDALEAFDPARMAGRILQQGDIVGLVERAEQALDRGEAERLAKRATSKRGMDLGDFLAALTQIQAMGPLEGLLGMLPGMNAKALKQAKVDPRRLKHVEAIIRSMTPEERSRPEILNGSRRARISRGAGRPVQEINQLLGQFDQMRKMMKGFGKTGRR